MLTQRAFLFDCAIRRVLAGMLALNMEEEEEEEEEEGEEKEEAPGLTKQVPDSVWMRSLMRRPFDIALSAGSEANLDTW